ncbi:MAG: methyltransferase domain-containing protein [Pseudomonadota bacterium]
MAETSKGQSLLENAYKLATPEDNKAYYAEFAATYDADFAGALGYHYPVAIASVYRERATERDRPVADIGCGTGLVAEALALAPAEIDGIDISAEMLARAAEKGLYRATLHADLTADLAPLARDYGAVVSAGTFTSGHLGPEPLEPLLGIARPGALFVLGVNKAFFVKAGFEAVIRGLEGRGAITDLGLVEVAMYARPGHEHSDDRAYALTYRKRA